MNHPVFTYTCNSCKNSTRGMPRRAPSDKIFGRSMLEVLVCRDCEQKHALNIKNGFWGMDKVPTKGKTCTACPGELDGQHGLAHVEPNPDGSWRLARVCAPCFGEFAAVCRENMKS